LSQGGESPTNEDMSDLPVDITRYESEAQRIAQEDAEREKKKSRLQKAREKLQEYLDKFQTRENQDDSVKKLIQDAQADMKKIDEELNKL